MPSPEYEMEIIEEATGKLPAMRELDFMKVITIDELLNTLFE